MSYLYSYRFHGGHPFLAWSMAARVTPLRAANPSPANDDWVPWTDGDIPA